MNNQKILLIPLVIALVVTLGLYILKAVKQVRYKNDERWTTIQLKANNVANLSNWILIVGLCILQMMVDSAMTITIQRLVTYGLIFFGARNVLELGGIVFYDKVI